MAQLLDLDALYPWLNDGLDFLLEKEAVSGRDYAKLSKTEKLKVIGSATLRSKKEATRLRSSMADSFKAGESEAEFAQRIKDVVDLKRSDANRILRTATKQSYVEGQAKSIEQPHIKSTFPYVMYVATHDGRTRHLHAAVDGFVVEVGSQAYYALQAARRDYQCRCDLISLTEKQASGKTIKTYSDLPADFRAAYG